MEKELVTKGQYGWGTKLSEFIKRREDFTMANIISPQREDVTDVEEYTTYVVRDKKFPYHAYCTNKETGMVVEQAGQSKSHAIYNAEYEMRMRIKNGKTKANNSEQE